MNSRAALIPLLAALLGASDCGPDINDEDVTIAVTSRVSVNASGGQANNLSRRPSITPDGRFVAFESRASDLILGTPGGISQIYRKDLLTGDVVLISVNTTGAAGNRDSFNPSISADGNRVAFDSESTNLAATDTGSEGDVFVRDVQGNLTIHISQAEGGGPSTPASDGSLDPSLSADGKFVAYSSDASDLVSSPVATGDSHVYRTEVDTGVTDWVSVNDVGDEEAGSSSQASISGNGRHIAFVSFAADLVSGDTNGLPDIFVRDMQVGTTERVSVEAPGNPDGVGDGDNANGTSQNPILSSDGRLVAFESSAPDLVAGDLNGFPDVFIRDLSLPATTLVSRSSQGVQGSGDSSRPAISGDGRYVVFDSSAANLVAGDTNLKSDVFWHDRLDGRTVRISVNTGLQEGLGGDSAFPAISDDGRVIVFHSGAQNLVTDDSNGVNDVFVRSPLH